MAKKKENFVYYPGRIRNVLRGEKAKIQVGYTGKPKDRKDGDTWTDEDGKQWIRENGITKSVPKLDGVRVPIFCPECKGIMGKSQKDTDVYWKFGFCLNCLIKRDTEMVINGEYKQYQMKYTNQKMKGFLLEAKDYIEEYIEKIKHGVEIVGADGTIEKWSGDDDKVKEFWQNELEEVNSVLAELEKLEEEKGEEECLEQNMD